MFSNEAFAQNAEKYMDTVFRVAYGWLKNPDDANDAGTRTSTTTPRHCPSSSRGTASSSKP